MLLEDVQVQQLSLASQDEEVVLRDFVFHVELASCRQEVEGSGATTLQTVWTDGSCPHNQEDKIPPCWPRHFLQGLQGMLPRLL